MSIITKSAVLAAILVGVFVVPARAEDIITVKVPFAFTVDRAELPAGDYDLRKSDDSADVLWIEGLSHRSVAVVLTNRVDGRDPAGTRPALVFTKSENGYQLSQIWQSPTNGRELTAPAGAHHARRQATLSDPESVTIAAQAK